MLDRSLSAAALGGLTLAGSFVAAAAAKPQPQAKPRPAPTACSQSALSPYVESVRAAAASFVDDLGKIGGSTGAIASVGITLANGQHLKLTFSGGTLKLSGSGVPAACKTIVANDDWEGTG